MGCGQSKIGNIYPKNKKNKNNNGKKNGDSVGSASIEQKNGNGNAKNNKTNNNGTEASKNQEDQNGLADPKNQKKKPTAPGGGPLLQQAEISTSQLDFFRMLDEKIENGPDYDESLDSSARAERVSSLLRQWELASVSWSSVSDLNQQPQQQQQHSATTSPSQLKNRGALSASRQNLSAKDREGMRNIVGGRPESAPIYVRNANRVDGLQDTHCPSPNMPRHVLESITQSPTQSLKNSTPPSSSPTSLRYHDSAAYKELNANQPMPKTVKAHYALASPSPMNGEFVSQQLYREQYLQQTGIITVPAQYSSSSPASNILRSSSGGGGGGGGSPYEQKFQIYNPSYFPAPRKRGFNTAQMT